VHCCGKAIPKIIKSFFKRLSIRFLLELPPHGYQKSGTNGPFLPFFEFIKVNEENLHGERPFDSPLGFLLTHCTEFAARRVAKMNAHQTDYSFALGVASAVLVLGLILTVAIALKALWKTHHTAQLERQWRKQ
jgi:hypothetical protein